VGIEVSACWRWPANPLAFEIRDAKGQAALKESSRIANLHGRRGQAVRKALPEAEKRLFRV